MNTIKDPFSKDLKKTASVPSKQESILMQYCEAFSSIATESFYVLDIAQKQFHYIKPNDFFLCGHSVEEAMTLGYDFYPLIIYPEDLPLWASMLEIVEQYLKNLEENPDEIDYFSCAFRLQRKYSFVPHPLRQMVYFRMKPYWINGELRHLICTMESSAIKNAGSLHLHKMGYIYKEYKFTTKRWHLATPKILTECETSILMLADQGKSSKEIAEILCKGQHTIQNQTKALFAKLGVHSIKEAIEVAKHYCRLQVTDPLESSKIKTNKRKRVSFTNEQIQHIQELLNKGKSIRQIANTVGAVESTIRYWISKGILRKK